MHNDNVHKNDGNPTNAPTEINGRFCPFVTDFSACPDGSGIDGESCRLAIGSQPSADA
ncbi:hypothetical protein [Sphingorhabdus profundilacus]|uniref:hypothetical protein n=1 Tax=Sphingorhabdus profundilacus TaxID=2509718 RepID=UPI001FEB5F81|nr:hypothetical protein [Sphingorhabdus profundilacus]